MFNRRRQPLFNRTCGNPFCVRIDKSPNLHVGVTAGGDLYQDCARWLLVLVSDSSSGSGSGSTLIALDDSNLSVLHATVRPGDEKRGEVAFAFFGTSFGSWHRLKARLFSAPLLSEVPTRHGR